MANRFFSNVGKFYTTHVYPVLIDCNFIIDSTNGNGLGVRSLKGQGVNSVQAYSTVSAASPDAGYFKVNLSDAYYRYYGGFSGYVSPTSGSTAINALVANKTYIIATLGTSTTANWVTAGLPVGVTPAVGVSFQAAGSVASLGTGTCTLPTVSTVGNIEIVGNPNLTLAPVGLGAANPYIWMKFIGATSSSVTTPIAKQPADGTTVGIAMYLSNSSVEVAGE